MKVSPRARAFGLALGRTLRISAVTAGVVIAIASLASFLYASFGTRQIVEIGNRDALYRLPLHPYTRALFSAVPVPDPKIESTRQRIILAGDVPSPIHPPSGCRFRTRCFKARDRCAQEIPPLDTVQLGDHEAACFFPLEAAER